MRSIAKHRTIVLFSAGVVASILCAARPAPCEPPRSVSVTVYNQDLALISETRQIAVERGITEVPFPDVSSMMDPASVQISFSGRGPEVDVISQNYRFDVAGMGRLLELGLEQEVSVRTEGGELFRGLLIGHDTESLIIQEESGSAVVVRRQMVTDVRFHELSDELVVRPTLVWQLGSREKGTREVEVSYLTSGMTWRAEYAARLSADEKAMELSAWASVENKTGLAFAEATLTLVAGKVHRAGPIGTPPRMLTPTAMDEYKAPSFEEEDLFEYHAYSLDVPLTVLGNESVQLALFPSTQVAFDRVYTYDATRFSKGVKVSAKTTNTEGKGLGFPMPGGKIRVYSGDGAKSRLVGEDFLQQTPIGAEIELFLGLAFDVKGERKRTDYRRLGRDEYQESYELTLKNSKSEAVDVVVMEHPRGDWNITETNLPYEQKDYNTVQWILSVPASGEGKVSYTVQYRS